MNVDPKVLRFVSLFLAPVFLWVKTRTGIEVPESVLDLMLVGVITYIGGSHAKEALVASAKAKGAAAASAVTTPADAAAVLGSEPAP